MMSTMLKLKCPSCKKNFIIEHREYTKKFKNIKKHKNLNKLFLKNVKTALKHPELLSIAYSKTHYEIEK